MQYANWARLVWFGQIWLFKIMTIYLIRPNQTKPAKVVCYILLDPSHFSINGNTSEVQTIIYSRIHKKQSTKSPSLRMEGSKIQKLLRERRIETDWQLSGIAWSNKLWWFSWLITLPLGWQKIVSAIWLSQLGFYRIQI